MENPVKGARSLLFGGFATLVVIFCDSSGDPLLCEGRRPTHLVFVFVFVVDYNGDPLLCEGRDLLISEMVMMIVMMMVMIVVILSSAWGRRPAHLGAGQMAFQTSKNLRTADEWWLRWVAWSKENVTFLSENDKSFLIDWPASFVLLSWTFVLRTGAPRHGGKFFFMRTCGCGSSWHVDVDLVALLIKLYRVLLDRPWCHW